MEAFGSASFHLFNLIQLEVEKYVCCRDYADLESESSARLCNPLLFASMSSIPMGWGFWWICKGPTCTEPVNCTPTCTAPVAATHLHCACHCTPPADHFQHEHYLCPHPACLEKKFIVFSSEQELKTHTAR